jgi:hypothetical protein
MFGKPARETPKPETTSAVPELKLPENFIQDSTRPEAKSLAKTSKDNLSLSKIEVEEPETSELINSIEKISRIASPYFIAIVGLSLYKDNFFIGTILISVGILSLLKVSARDVATFLEWLKHFLGFGDEEN